LKTINKAILFGIYFFRTERERNLLKPVGLDVAVLFLEYTFVFRERKD